MVLGIDYQRDEHFARWLQFDDSELAPHFRFVDTDVNYPINIIKEILGCSHDLDSNLDSVTAPSKIVPEGDLRNVIAGHPSSLLGNCAKALRMAPRRKPPVKYSVRFWRERKYMGK